MILISFGYNAFRNNYWVMAAMERMQAAVWMTVERVTDIVSIAEMTLGPLGAELRNLCRDSRCYNGNFGDTDSIADPVRHRGVFFPAFSAQSDHAADSGRCASRLPWHGVWCSENYEAKEKSNV